MGVLRPVYDALDPLYLDDCVIVDVDAGLVISKLTSTSTSTSDTNSTSTSGLELPEWCVRLLRESLDAACVDDSKRDGGGTWVCEWRDLGMDAHHLNVHVSSYPSIPVSTSPCSCHVPERRIENRDAGECFVKFFVCLFGAYRRFIVPNPKAQAQTQTPSQPGAGAGPGPGSRAREELPYQFLVDEFIANSPVQSREVRHLVMGTWRVCARACVCVCVI